MNLTDTKLADITTGNKVRGTALGNLASIPSSAGLIPLANIPVLGATFLSLASIPNSALYPLTLTSWVDGAAMRNIQSMPSLAGQLAWYSIVSSLASGSSIKFDGVSKFVGGQGLQAYSAGSYQISENGLYNTASGSPTSYTKVDEIYISRNGTLTIKFDTVFTSGPGGIYGTIYRNGSAVGTERLNTGAFTTYSEDISGWAIGDLCQLYIKVVVGTDVGTYGGLRVSESAPIVEKRVSTYTPAITKIWTGIGVPNNSIGVQGDIYLRTDGGATTTLYVKTGASTWTAK